MSLQIPEHATDAELSGLFRILETSSVCKCRTPFDCDNGEQCVLRRSHGRPPASRFTGAFERYTAAAAAVVLRSMLVMVLAIGVAQHVHAVEVEPLVMYKHRSNLFDGPPFNRNAESTEDFVCAGASIKWRTVELDACHGLIARDCNYLRTSVTAAPCKWEQGTEVSTRWYPRRRRGLR
jgi:hypothetical protein